MFFGLFDTNVILSDTVGTVNYTHYKALSTRRKVYGKNNNDAIHKNINIPRTNK